MSEHSVEVLEAKLDILIADFQTHRKASVKQEQIEKIWGILKMHSVVGTFTFSIITAYLVSLIVK